MFKKSYFVIFCFLLCGCPFDRGCGFNINYINILNLEADPLYYKIVSAKKERTFAINYNRVFSLPYGYTFLECHNPDLRLIPYEDKSEFDSATYSFYDNDKMEKSLFSINSDELKKIVADTPSSFRSDTYMAVITQGKIQYLDINERLKKQPQAWNRKHANYLTYNGLMLNAYVMDHLSDDTRYENYELSINFQIFNWLFRIKQPDTSYQFNPAQVYIIHNGQRVYLTPQNAAGDLQDIFPDMTKFWLSRKFIYQLPYDIIDNKTIYIGGISVDGQNLDVYDYQL